MKRISIAVCFILLAAVSISAADRTMKNRSLVTVIKPASDMHGVNVYWRYVEGLGVKLVKLSMENKSSFKYTVKFKVSVFNGGQTIKSWQVEQTISPGRSKGAYDGFDMEKHLDTYVDSIKIEDISYTKK